MINQRVQDMQEVRAYGYFPSDSTEDKRARKAFDKGKTVYLNVEDSRLVDEQDKYIAHLYSSSKVNPASNMTAQEESYVDMAVQNNLKSKGTAFILSLLFGALGIAHFYTGNVIYGVVILIGSIIGVLFLGAFFIPICIVLTIVDCFVSMGEVTTYNRKQRLIAIQQIQLQRIMNNKAE
ncbi:TM2 domain-containing protein [Listeria booriae]|uniref:TM2 domain-containing protein n=1 Tax=Listeria booriae TaxID=1552123 RepID=UPI001625DE0A|nr:TM2 domain-containing protein [Listeria booriae]MBC2164941.1 TM2 domain-containing protein [Listeria booriae]